MWKIVKILNEGLILKKNYPICGKKKKKKGKRKKGSAFKKSERISIYFITPEIFQTRLFQ